MIISKEPRFKRGDTAVCVINSRASLTVGKEYKVIEVYIDTDYVDLVIINDKGEDVWYDQMRFITKDEFRNHTLNEILK